MAEPAAKRMTIDEFLAWHDRRPEEERYELVDGRPRLMVRPLIIHQLIVGNVYSELADGLDDGPCLALPEVLVEVAPNTFRVPDVSVFCDLDDLDRRYGDEPVVLVEVLSPSTMDIDLFGKHDEYRSIPGLRHFAFVSADRAQVAVWSKDGDKDGDGVWSVDECVGLDTVASFHALGLELSLAEIYRNTSLS